MGTVVFSARNRRWWILGIALATVIVAAVATVLALTVRTVDGSPRGAVVQGMPAQTLLASSMRQQPVAGWEVTVDQLALPAGTVVRPFGNVGDRGLFLGITDEGWWMVGLNLDTGDRAFGPVRLGPAEDATSFNCYVNGPPNVLCIRQKRDINEPATAWVVDTDSGKLVFDGPTDVRIGPADGHPNVEQVGDHAVAAVTGQGVHGIGARGELTWFVPGDGFLSATQSPPWDRDDPPPALAAQGGRGAMDADIVFSVADGATVEPAVPQDIKLGRALVYSGGIGYGYTIASDKKDRVAFFDYSGKKLSVTEVIGTLETGSLDLPVVAMGETQHVVVAFDGRRLAELPPSMRMPSTRLIGTRLFTSADENSTAWQQYDLLTGESGKPCEGRSLGAYYRGSDGEVVVALDEGDGLVHGVDLTTCDVLWSIPGSASNEAKEVWKVNTTLVQRTNDKIFSLVAPN